MTLARRSCRTHVRNNARRQESESRVFLPLVFLSGKRVPGRGGGRNGIRIRQVHRLYARHESSIALALALVSVDRSESAGFMALEWTIKRYLQRVSGEPAMPHRDIKRRRRILLARRREHPRGSEAVSAARSRQRADRVGARVTRSLAVTMAAATLRARARTARLAHMRTPKRARSRGSAN